MPNSTVPSVIAVIPNAKHRLHEAAMLLLSV